MTEEKKKSKCFLAAIWESITKVGGCCGSSEVCDSPSQPEKETESCQEEEKKEDKPCCSS